MNDLRRENSLSKTLEGNVFHVDPALGNQLQAGNLNPVPVSFTVMFYQKVLAVLKWLRVTLDPERIEGGRYAQLVAHEVWREILTRQLRTFWRFQFEEARRTRREIPPNAYIYLYRRSPEGVPCIISARANAEPDVI